MPQLRRIVGLLALGSLGLASCQKEYFDLDRMKDPEYNPTVAAPLIHSTITVPDVLDRFDDGSVVVYTPDGMLALRYKSTIFSQDVNSFFNLSNFSSPQVNDGLNVGEIATLAASDVNHGPITVPLTIGVPSGAQLNAVNYKAGNAVLTIDNPMSATATVTVSIPELSGGSLVANVAANQNGQVFSFPLAGRVLTMGTANTINPSATITYHAPGTALVTDQFHATLSFQNQEFSAIFGNMGQQSFSTGLDSVRVKIFENSTDGTIIWEEPKIITYFYNSFGADLQVNVNSFEAYSQQNNVYNPVLGFPSNLFLAGAATPGQEVLTKDSLTTATPGNNILTVANSLPSWIRYDVAAMTNPGLGPWSNFALDTSRVRLDMEVFLPFHGRAIDFTQVDTTDFEIPPDSEDIKEVYKVTLRLSLNNGFPCDGAGQVYFTDSNFVVVDSLMSNPNDMFIRSGLLDASGRVVTKTLKVTDIVLDRPKIEKLRAQNASKIIMKGWIETTNGGATVVKVYKDYTMEIKLGAMVEFKTTLQVP